MIFSFPLLWKQVSENNYNDDGGTLQCDYFDIGIIRCGNNNTLPFYLLWKQVSILVWAFDDYHNDVIINHAIRVHDCENNNFIVNIVCDMSRVEYKIGAYTVVCSMIHLTYIPSVLLVASLEISIFFSRLCSNTSFPLYFVYSSIPGLYSSIMSSNTSLLLSLSQNQVQVQVCNNNHNNINYDDANSYS